MRQRWTPEQLDGLRRLYPDFEASVVAKVLGRKVGSVHQMANKLGIAKSEAFDQAYRERQARRARVDPRVKAGSFKPGRVPWNKGKNTVAGGRSAETRFKPGSAPVNTMPIGSYRVAANAKRGQSHVEIKVSDKPGRSDQRWTPVTRWVWEQAHGPVPAGHLVVFKAGMKTLDPALITLDRVELITMAENARRNHWRTASPELGQIVQLKGAITRQVNRIKKQAKNHAEEATES